MQELQTEYLESFTEKFQLWRKLFTEEQWDSLEMEFHKMKGTGSTYGVPEVSLLCQHLERICQSQKAISHEFLDTIIRMLGDIKLKYLANGDYNLAEDPDFEKIQNLS